MDKITKFLRQLRAKEYEAFLLLLKQIKFNYTKVPHLVALFGMKNWYRVRFGRYRIIFYVFPDGTVEIRRITKRDEQSYKNL